MKMNKKKRKKLEKQQLFGDAFAIVCYTKL